MQKTFWNIPFLVLLTGAFVTVFNIGVTNVALPTIAQKLNANGLQIHLIASGLTITLASFVLFTGAIGDKYGRKMLFILGSVIMLLASTLSGLSTTANELIMWRMVAGIATAMLYPTTLSMITTLYTNPKQRVVAIGLWSGVSAAGAAIAPVIAGAVLQEFSWGYVFLVSVPFIAVMLFAGVLYLREHKNIHAPAIDYIGSLCSVISISLLLFAIILYPVDGFSERVTISFIISFLSLLCFIFWELKTPHPLLDLRLFKSSRFSLASLTITLVAFAQLGVMFLAQQFVQNVLGYTTLQAGFSVLPLSIAVFIASPLSAKLDMRFGSKKTIATGLFIIGIGFVSALFWTVHSTYLQILLSYILIGTGLGLTMTPSTNAIMNTLPEEKAGIGSAVNDVTRDLGNSLGIAVNGSIAAVSYASVLKDMYNNTPSYQQVQISENIARTITSSLSGALEVAKRYPSVDTQTLVTAAKQAFLDGQLAAMGLSAILCLAGSIIILLFMPARARKKE